jgi:hypothetical protein
LLRRTTTLFTLALATTLPIIGGGLATGAASAKETRQSTLKFEDFESAQGRRTSGTSFAHQVGGSDDASIVNAGGKAGKVYRLELEAGTIHGNPSGNHGVVAMVPLPRQVDNACIRYRIRFGDNFDWSKGGKLPGLSGVAPGVSPTYPAGGGNPGDKGWSGRLMWGSGGAVESYMYYPDQPYTYGQGFDWSGKVSDGRWHHLRQCYVMNTVGKDNGKLRAWLDGTPVLNRTDFVYRLKSSVHISHMMWSIFRGGATMDWAGRRDSHIDFDRVRVTTRS